MRFSGFTERIGGEGAEAWAIHWEAVRAAARGKDVIVLTQGDPDFSTPAPIVERAVAALRAGDTHYAAIEGREPLRAAIAAGLKARTAVGYGAGNVTVFAGAQNALFAASLCLLEAGDEAIVLDPVYVTYEATIRASGAGLVRVAQPADGGFRPDVGAIAAAVTPRTRAIFLTTPNNPTGVVMTKDELEAIAAVARERDLWVVADEVYGELVFEGEHFSVAGLPGMAERTVTIGSLSKSHAMTGWRIGWAVGPEPLAGHFGRLALAMLYGLPGFCQEAALTALTEQAGAAAEMRERYRRRRDLVCARLAKAPGLRVLKPQAGMFVMADVTGLGMEARAFAGELWRETGVAVLDAGAFGAAARGWVRISFTLDEARLAEACERILGFAKTRVVGQTTVG